MSRIANRHTKPELAVRSLLHAMGLRFRLHKRDLPGSPDIVLPRHKLVVFVHGCFWHQHPGCRRATLPKTRMDFWNAKFATNRLRDAVVQDELRALGWGCVVVWECETRKLPELSLRLRQLIIPSTQVITGSLDIGAE